MSTRRRRRGANIPEVVRAKAFELVNELGYARAKLEITEDGSTAFYMLDQNGRLRLAEQVDRDGQTSLTLNDQNEQMRLAASLKRLRPASSASI